MGIRALAMSYIYPWYRGTSLTRKRTPLGPYRRPRPRVLGGSLGGERFLMGEVPLYHGALLARNVVIEIALRTTTLQRCAAVPRRARI